MKYCSLFSSKITLGFSCLVVHVNARAIDYFNNGDNSHVFQQPEAFPRSDERLSRQQQEQHPNFIPQTQSGYGLYGHETGMLPPASTTNNMAESEFQARPLNMAIQPESNNPMAYMTKSDGSSYSSLPRNYNSKAYKTEPQGKGDTRFETSRNYVNGNDNGYHSAVQRQGMSDTRFLENGRYFYDINNEKYSQKAFENSREFGSMNQMNNNRVYYGNNENSHDEYNNSMQRYQNEDEFRDDNYP